MIHLGDITKVCGAEIEPVDCITFGSPCQDLSVAGKRAGLAGERSGLFVEAVRIIKEMRKATNGMYPTFAVWENVPGAFSSNGGEDFRAVLEELACVEQPDTVIPRPPRGGRWSKAGAIAGNGWSLAWRQFDSQYWGVPQRRKRIALVVDFAGRRAGEILFERESLPGRPDQSIPTRKEAARTAGNRPAGNDRMVEHATPINMQIATRYKALGERTGLGIGQENDPAYTLQAGHEHGVCYCISGNTVDRETNQNGTGVRENGSFTVNTVDRPAVALEYQCEPNHCAGFAYKAGAKAGGTGFEIEKSGTLYAERHDAAVIEKTTQWIVRRLTPTECERLQGYPDGWTDIGEWVDTKGKKHKPADSPRYKALGNSIALPQWFWIAQKMRPYVGDSAKLGSLFDGIGGFPLVWETTYGTGTARWASEIEEFPIAVTKLRFPEKETKE